MRLRTLIATAMITCLLPLTAWASPGPKEVIQGTVDTVIDILKARENSDVLTAENRQAIRKAVEGGFDFPEMAKRSLSKGWRAIGDSQRQAFTVVFRDLLERSYGNRLAGFSGQTVEYGEVKEKNKNRVVETEIVDAKRRTPVEYSLHETKDGWRVYNIVIEGVSLVSTYRSSFKREMKKKGFDGLMKNMTDKLKRLKKEDE